MLLIACTVCGYVWGATRMSFVKCRAGLTIQGLMCDDVQIFVFVMNWKAFLLLVDVVRREGTIEVAVFNAKF